MSRDLRSLTGLYVPRQVTAMSRDLRSLAGLYSPGQVTAMSRDLRPLTGLYVVFPGMSPAGDCYVPGP